MREQLWRYFPALLELETDLGAEWLLDLWEVVPTPAKAARIREVTVAKLLKRNRTRRFDAAHVLDVLRAPPVKVAPRDDRARQRPHCHAHCTHPAGEPAAQVSPSPARRPDRPPHPDRGDRAGGQRPFAY
ncbi:hypothetical protein [Nitratireductor luteus]|uniref:hypothetical protein n=1 Tax=Nitratireductor luteus TaxID=2976980 RepID=UPI0022400D7A|nr:hypothetical protein [Nitratireductor luteus]